jgi:hypothetical protein
MGLSRLLLPVYSQLRGETAVEEHHGQAFFTLKHFSPVCSLLCGEAAMEVHHDQACYKLKLTSACTACPRRAVQGAAGTGGAHSAPLHDAHNTPPAARTHACTTKWRSGHLYPRLHHEVAKWALVPTQWALAAGHPACLSCLPYVFLGCSLGHPEGAKGEGHRDDEAARPPPNRRGRSIRGNWESFSCISLKRRPSGNYRKSLVFPRSECGEFALRRGRKYSLPLECAIVT